MHLWCAPGAVPSEALGAGYLWWTALLAKSDLTDVMHALPWDPTACGDRQRMRAIIFAEGA